ncbi:MAG: serine hydrolase [Chitinophagaceae bacterium]|nr:serine hydrolase [Chitinophagaceae bacterium]
MGKRFLSLWALLILCSVVQSQAVDKRFAGLDTAFARVLKDWHAAGFAVAVVEKNKIIYAKGFGYRDVEKKLSVTPNTLFAIGSCTKAFTSSLIGLLEKDGKVNLDKPVRTYLPELEFYNNDLNNSITLRDMMCHRTGLPRHDYAWYLFPTTRDSLIHRIRYQEPTFPLRSQYQYNNFMFLAQGVVAEKLFNSKWETLVKEKFFDQLGMTTSNFSVTEMSKSSDAAIGYSVKKDSLIHKLDYFNIDAMGPAGSINSSVSEMANWVIAWINGGKFNGNQVIPASYVNQAMSSQMISSASLPDKEVPDVFLSTYGFGWAMAAYRGHYRVQHGGNIDGFSANVSFYPSDSIGIIVLSNQNSSVVPSVVRNIITDRVLGLKRNDWNTFNKIAADKAREAERSTAQNANPNQKKNTPLSHPLTSYEGLYTNPGYGVLDVEVKNDSIFASTTSDKIWLRHFHYDIFELFDVDKRTGIDTSNKANSRFQFNMNTSGDIESLSTDLQPGLKPIVFERSAKSKSVSRADLSKYVGDYVLSPTVTTKIYIKDETTLYVLVPGQPDYETVPIGNHEFKLKTLNGFSVRFDVDSTGTVTGLSFVQPNGIFKAMKK